MLGLLLLLFVAVPVTELIILIRLGQAFGLSVTAVIVLGTGVVGAALARAEGLRTARAMRREIAAGHVPGRQIFDGVSVLVGGAMLLTPGLMTDGIGLALLFPPTRGALQAIAWRWLERQLLSGALRVGVLPWDMGHPSSRRGAGGARTGPEQGPLDSRHEIRVPPPEERR